MYSLDTRRGSAKYLSIVTSWDIVERQVVVSQRF